MEEQAPMDDEGAMSGSSTITSEPSTSSRQSSANKQHIFKQSSYERRGDRGDNGRIFESDMARIPLIRSALKGEYDNSVAMEMKLAGVFDDAVTYSAKRDEATFIQAKHAETIGPITIQELLPECEMKGNNYDLYLYAGSYARVEYTLKDSLSKRNYVIATTNSIEPSEELGKWFDIEPRSVNELIDIPNAVCIGLRPKPETITKITSEVNQELNDLLKAIIELFKQGTWCDKLNDNKPFLKTILKVSNNYVMLHEDFSASSNDVSRDEIYKQLKSTFQLSTEGMKSLRTILQVQNKNPLNGSTKFANPPPFITDSITEKFFKDLTLCTKVPGDSSKVSASDLRDWMKGLVRPEVLQNIDSIDFDALVRKFATVFNEWKNSEPESRKKSFLSAKEVQPRIDEIKKKYSSNDADAQNRNYINRMVKVPGISNIRDEDLVKQLENGNNLSILGENGNNMSILGENGNNLFILGENGMGKTEVLRYIGFEAQKRFKWDVFYISLRKIRVKLNAPYENNFSEILKDVLADCSLKILQQKIEEQNTTNTRTLLLFDGLDDINTTQMNNAIAMFQHLLQYQNVQMVISARQHMEASLQDAFNDVQPVSIAPLDDDQQQVLLGRYLSDQDGDDEHRVKSNMFAKRLLAAIHSRLERYQRDFSGNPFLIRLIAEKYRKGFKDFLSPGNDNIGDSFSSDVPSVLNLFRNIENEALKVELKRNYDLEAYSETGTFSNEIQTFSNEMVDNFIQEHEFLAVIQLGVVELEPYLRKDRNVALYIKRIEDGSQRSLLLNFANGDNAVEFSHMFFAEYYASNLLYENVEKANIEGNLFRILAKYPGIRRFFFWRVEEIRNDVHMDILSEMCNTHSEVAFWACEANCLNVLKKILQNNDLRTMRQPFYGSLLHTAVSVGSEEMVTYLVGEYGIDVNIYHELEGTPLVVASSKGYWQIVLRLIEYAANVNAQNVNLMTPLHFAAQNGYREIIQRLIEKGANVESRNNEGKTPYDLALANDQYVIALDIEDALNEFLIKPMKKMKSPTDEYGNSYKLVPYIGFYRYRYSVMV